MMMASPSHHGAATTRGAAARAGRGVVAGAVMGVLAAGLSAAEAQTPLQITALGSEWGYYLYETGGAQRAILDGEPAFLWGQPDAVITIVSRDGKPVDEADRDAAIAVAQRLCRQTGRMFDTHTRGTWLPGGGLGFQGACTQW